ncbi:MAG TPA: hypothetical protein VM029_13960 [Opitutaceae bacterium]|nr:hypothetical protein [Opitutaceae bacterium]
MSVTGSGDDVWGNADSFLYYHRPWSGDGEIIARLSSFGDTTAHPWAKAGLMFRDGTGPGARNVFMCFAKSNGTVLQSRANAGGETALAWGREGPAPRWLKLGRVGDTFTGYESADGVAWQPVAAVTMAGLPAALRVGLAVSSHQAGITQTATFEHVLTGVRPAPPAAPSGLRVAGFSSSTIDLTWTDNANNEAGFQLQRLSNNGWRPIATLGPNVTDFRDVGLEPNTPNWYRVYVFSATGGSMSNQLSANTAPAGSPPPEPPPGTPSLNTYNQGTSGSAAYDSTARAWSVSGGGADIWGNADAFTFAAQQWTGDVELVARVASLDNTNPWAKAGVMFRESMEAGARNIFLAATPANGIELQARTVTGGATNFVSRIEIGLPIWFKLTRQGNVFRAYRSNDGQTWTDFGAVALELPASLYVGLAVTSHAPETLSTARFTDVYLGAVRPPPAPRPAAPSGLRATATSATDVDVSWIDNSNDETGFRVERATGGGAFVPVASMPANTTGMRDAGRSPSTTYTYRVLAYSSGGDSAYSAVATVTTPASPSAPPATPSDLVAEYWKDRIELRWTDNSSNEGGFTIERATDGTTYQVAGTVGAGVTIYSDFNLSSGPMTYSYRVRAFNGSAVSAYSAIARLVTGAGPPGYTAANIGSPTPSGTVAQSSSGTWTVAGGGADIWGTSDSFMYEYQSWSGDGEFVARVLTVDSTNGWGKAGIMFREGSGASARNIFIAATASNGLEVQSRTTVGGPTDFVARSDLQAPIWLKLTRQGNLFRGYFSFDGRSWIDFGSQTFEMSGPLYVGLAMTSHQPGYLGLGRFSDVTFSSIGGPATPPLAPTNLTAVALSAEQVELRWTDNANNETSTLVERSTNNVSFTSVMSGGANATSLLDTTVSPSTTYYYRVRMSNSSGTSGFATASVTTPAVSSPLPAPSNLTASAVSASQVNLSWTDNSTTESGFRLERSTDGVSFQSVLWTDPDVRTVSDTTTAPATLYYYRVSARRGGEFSAPSNTVTVTTPGGSRPWFRADIGATGVAGSHSAGGNTITLRGSGADIWAGADAFSFLYQVVTGDCVVEAQVTDMSNTHDWAKAGVMIRENTTAGARNVFAYLTPTNDSYMQARGAAGQGTSIVAARFGTPRPYWVRLERSGNTITASTSANGVAWQVLQTYSLPIGAEALVGLAVTSHNNAVLNTAIFADPFIQ